jgi:cell division protein FtsN
MKQIFILFLLITFFLGMYMYVSNGFSFNKKDESKNQEQNGNCPNLLVRKDNKYYLKYADEKIDPIVFNDLNEYTDYLEKQRKNGRRCPVLYLQQENDLQGKDVYRVRPSPLEPNRGISSSPYIYLDTVENFDLDKITDEIKALNTRPGSQFTKAQDAPPAPATPPPAPATPPPATPPPATPPPATTPPATTPPPATPPATTPPPPEKIPIEVKDASRSYPPYNSGQYNGFDAHGQYIGQYTNLDKINESTEKEVISDNPMDPNWGGVLYTQQSIDTGKYAENNVYRSNYYTPKNGQFYPFAVNNTLVPPPPPATPAYPAKAG